MIRCFRGDGDKEYSDLELITRIDKILDENKNYTDIEISFWQLDEYRGCVSITFGKKPFKLGSTHVLLLHEINLETETFSDCVKEIQREKSLIKRKFKNIIVSSNLR
ncbi:MAG: hypothetical protein K6G88_11780 [Lachnospiraceae bacterium]|nr:hypothetical protein [Lachnospiraceae bacterium]